jgi:hypothetical protein
MSARDPVPEAIRELMARDRWVVWRYVERDGKPTKPPFNAETGEFAKSDDPSTWRPYAVAEAAASDFDGVGFNPAGEYVGVDLDHCLDPETVTLAPWARAIVARLRSYTEITPSGHGVRVWVRGVLPAGGRVKRGLGEDRAGAVELYSEGRYFTVTGDHLLGTPSTIEGRQAELEALHAEIFPLGLPSTERTPPPPPTDLDDVALIDRACHARNGEKFARLWAGDWAGAGYPSQSEADVAFCHLLAFWTGREAARMDRLFQQSGLMRPKWDARHFSDGTTYGQATIRAAIIHCRETYTPREDVGRPAPPTASHGADSAAAPSAGSDPTRAPLEGNAPILLDHLRYVVGVSVRLTPGGTVSIRPKAKLTAELRSALDGCLGDLRALLEAERQPVAREAGDTRPVLPGKVGDLKLDGAAAWQVLEQANVPPWLFRRFGTLVTIERDEDDRPIAKLLDVPRLAHQLASRAYFTVTRWVGDTPTEMPAPPPTVLVKDLLATPDPPAPVLLQIVGAPIVTPSGRLHDQPGYDPESRTLYVPAPGFVLPPVPPSPTDDELQAAVKTLLEPFLDFPFVDEADRTHALAALFTILARPLIPGPAPLFLFDKPRQGTGATLLATVIGLIANGQEPPVMAQGDDDAEWRKRLVAALLRAPAVLLLDNLTGDLDTPALSMILTTGYVLERLLGTMQDVTFKTTTVFLGTGNNVTLVGDMVRRHVPVRLDAKVEKPWMRARDGLVTFKQPKLLAWVTAQRGTLLAAAFTVIKAWIARGRPAAADTTLGSYERWAEVLGGLLALAGRSGFLSTLDEAYESVDPEQDATKRFLRLWWTTHKDTSQSASTLLPLASDLTVALPLGGKDDAGRAMSLGRWLARHARQTADLAPDLSVRLVRLPSGAQGTLWHLDPMRRPDPTAMGLLGLLGLPQRP